MRRFALILAISIFAGTFSFAVERLPEEVVLVREEVDGQTIKGLELPSGPLPIEFRQRPEGMMRVVKLKGEFIQPLWTLSWENKVLVEDPLHSTFTLEIPIVHRASKLTLVAISVNGDIVRESISLRYQQKLPPPERFRFGVSAGLSQINYNESGIDNFAMLAMTGKGIMQFLLVPGKFDLMVGGFMTLFPLSSSRDDGVWARFVGLNLRAGYILPFVTSPWRLSLNFGLYYTGMQVEDNLFGFSDMIGPQVFFVTDYAFSKTDRGTGYFKFSPVAKNLSFKLFSFGNREVAMGGGWVRTLESKNTISLMLDVSMFAMTFESVELGYRSVSLSFGFGF